jgi:hypothetical protein
MDIRCASCCKPLSDLDGARFSVSAGVFRVVPLHYLCKADFEDRHQVRTEYLEPPSMLSELRT